MKVRFTENKITDKIETMEVYSKVYRTCKSYKYGMSETMYYVWSKQINGMRWIWSSHCVVIEK